MIRLLTSFIPTPWLIGIASAGAVAILGTLTFFWFDYQATKRNEEYLEARVTHLRQVMVAKDIANQEAVRTAARNSETDTSTRDIVDQANQLRGTENDAPAAPVLLNAGADINRLLHGRD